MRIELFMTNPIAKTATLYLVSFAIGVFCHFICALSNRTLEQGCPCECASVRLFSTPCQSSPQDLARIDPSVALLCHKEHQNVRSDWDSSQTLQAVTTRLCQYVHHIPGQLCCEARNLV